MNRETLEKLLGDHQMYHSEFQMDYYITAINGGPTPYGRYRQSLRELDHRAAALKALYAQREIQGIDVEEAEQNICDNPFERRRRAVRLIQMRDALQALHRTIADTEREFRRFYQQCVDLKKQVGELTPERRRQLDEQMWRERLKWTAVLDLISTGRLGRHTVEMLLVAPQEWREDIRLPEQLQRLLNVHRVRERLSPDDETTDCVLPTEGMQALLTSASEGEPEGGTGEHAVVNGREPVVVVA